jgi:prepilin signal peptidase PulO-like enzyme (type II secretory pathway)
MIYFVFGLFLGSFLNNIALRLEKEEDFLFSRSKCPKCGKILTWKELIPILSFLFQKGKCKNCQAKISLRYPLVEIFTGLWVFLLAKTIFPTPNFLLQNPNFELLIIFLFYLAFLSILFVLALYDLRTFLVDSRLVLFGIFIGVLFNIFKNYFLQFPLFSQDFSYLFNNLIAIIFQFGKWEPIFSALFLSLFFLLIFLITKGRGMGFGDVEVAFLIGLFLKLGDGILSVIFASFFGSVYGIYLILKNKKITQPLPFVPFLFLGVLTTMFFGKYLTKLYFSYFNF